MANRICPKCGKISGLDAAWSALGGLGAEAVVSSFCRQCRTSLIGEPILGIDIFLHEGYAYTLYCNKCGKKNKKPSYLLKKKSAPSHCCKKCGKSLLLCYPPIH